MYIKSQANIIMSELTYLIFKYTHTYIYISNISINIHRRGSKYQQFSVHDLSLNQTY